MCYVNNNLSKYWSLGADAIDIPSGSDMHTYLLPGNYRCQSATIAKTLTNCPFQSAFTMKVYYSIGSKPSATDYYILQEYTRLDGGERVLVYFEAKNNKWASHAIAFKDDLNERFSSSDSGTTYNSVSDLPKTGSGFGTTTTGLTLYDGFKIPAYSRICFMNYGGSKDGAIFAIDGDGKAYTAFRNNGTWYKGNSLVPKDDLGVAEYNAGKSINISGRLSDIGKWLQTNGTTSRWMSVRANPTNTDGYFGQSTFSILWQCSSAEYGWCILISDNPKMVVFGRNSAGWHWYAPSLTEVS